MKKFVVLSILLAMTIGVALGWDSIGRAGAEIVAYFYDNPDMPSRFRHGLSKEEFMSRRAEAIGLKRGLKADDLPDPKSRSRAIRELERQELANLEQASMSGETSVLNAWSEIGPSPIPNAQVGTGAQTTASGRVTAIAVHPTNPAIVYVGTAQGGLYRSTNGGANWTRMMDNAESLAIGAIAIAPSQPDTVYVGTGESNFSSDCFFGVGVYRIDNASTTPVLTGPLNDDAANADVFTGRSVSEIAVHPTNPAVIFVSTTSGIGGLGVTPNPVLPARGLFRSMDATSADPTFTKIAVIGAQDNFSIRDIAMDPLNPNFLVVWMVANNGGIFVTANALDPVPTFSHPASGTITGTSTSELNGELAIQHTSGPNPTIYAAIGNGAGGVLVSTDGGSVWTLINTVNFCSPQCFYDIAVAVDPTNPSNVFLGGAPGLVFGRSANGGASFTGNGLNTSGLHVDTHVISPAPSNPAIVYFGSDGGVYKTNDVYATPILWTSLNNNEFSATQFMSVAVHPTDPNFSFGGTQDNGTNFFRPDATWTRADWGDGGYAAIDQNATNTTNVTMYHTYFNATGSLMGFARVSATTCATEGNWAFKGVGAVPFTNACGDIESANGISAGDAVLFYAPLELGPGNPNTVYYGTDRLYRSTDRGDSMSVVSQAPITPNVPISAIGISPLNDNLRVVGLQNGGIFGTDTGSATLTNLDPSNVVPNNFVARVVCDPASQDIIYVTLSNFAATNVWKTTNRGATWVPAATGIPQVPVNAFVIDPLDPNRLYAGTDIGVYTSGDAGATWTPYGTGLPRVAVFDMAIAPGNPRMVRIATHGRGMWQTPVAGTLSNVSISGRVTTPDGRGLRNAVVTLTSDGVSRQAVTSSFGFYTFSEVATGPTYTMSVISKRYRFGSQSVTPTGNLTNLDFIGQD